MPITEIAMRIPVDGNADAIYPPEICEFDIINCTSCMILFK